MNKGSVSATSNLRAPVERSVPSLSSLFRVFLSALRLWITDRVEIQQLSHLVLVHFLILEAEAPDNLKGVVDIYRSRFLFRLNYSYYVDGTSHWTCLNITLVTL